MAGIEFQSELENFLTYLKVVKNVSNHTLRNYNLDLKKFQSHSQLPLNEIDKRAIRAYLANLNQNLKAKRTILRRLSSLRSFFRYLTKEKRIKTNPMEEIESPKLGKRIPGILAYDQVERLFSQPDTTDYLGFRDRCIMELLYSSALRISELTGLNREDLDSRNQRLRVRGKGKKERIVPITKTATQWIHDYLNHPAFVHNQWQQQKNTCCTEQATPHYLYNLPT